MGDSKMLGRVGTAVPIGEILPLLLQRYGISAPNAAPSTPASVAWFDAAFQEAEVVALEFLFHGYSGCKAAREIVGTTPLPKAFPLGGISLDDVVNLFLGIELRGNSDPAFRLRCSRAFEAWIDCAPKGRRRGDFSNVLRKVLDRWRAGAPTETQPRLF